MQILYETPSKIILNNDQLIVNGKQHQREGRKLSKLKDVLKRNPDLDKGDPDIYHMFREVYRKGDIRFDITIIKGKPIEDEFAKTYGHAHPKANESMTYPEIYQVLSGSGCFLLQKTNRDESVDVLIIKAARGDILLIPPNFAHVSINTGSDDLILSNIVYDKFESDYTDFKTNRGAALYITTDGNTEQNSNYIIHNISRPNVEEFNKSYGFECKDILAELDQNPAKFEFLKDPALFFKV
jgi:glucose-6-phosphate isomerase